MDAKKIMERLHNWPHYHPGGSKFDKSMDHFPEDHIYRAGWMDGVKALKDALVDEYNKSND